MAIYSIVALSLALLMGRVGLASLGQIAILAVGGNSLIRTAMDATRPGGRIMLFAQTVHGDATFEFQFVDLQDVDELYSLI